MPQFKDNELRRWLREKTGGIAGGVPEDRPKYPVADFLLPYAGGTQVPITAEQAKSPAHQVMLGGDNPLDPMNKIDAPLEAIITKFPLLAKAMKLGHNIDPKDMTRAEFAAKLYARRTDTGSLSDELRATGAIEQDLFKPKDELDYLYKLVNTNPELAQSVLKTEIRLPSINSEAHKAVFKEYKMNPKTARGFWSPPAYSPSGKSTVVSPLGYDKNNNYGVLRHELEHADEFRRDPTFISRPVGTRNLTELKEKAAMEAVESSPELYQALLNNPRNAKKIINEYLDSLENSQEDVTGIVQRIHKYGHHKQYPDMEVDYPLKTLTEHALKDGESVNPDLLLNYPDLQKYTGKSAIEDPAEKEMALSELIKLLTGINKK